MSLRRLSPGTLGTGALVNSGPVPFALQKRMRSAAQRALSWTPRESSVWVSTLPAPARMREASWPRKGELAGGPGSMDRQTSLLPADRDECSDRPRPCSHSCHNAPGRFSCSCPAGFALARDGRTCRGERAPGGEAHRGPGPGARREIPGLDPGPGAHPSGDVSRGVPMPYSHGDLAVLRASEWGGSSTWG